MPVGGVAGRSVSVQLCEAPAPPHHPGQYYEANESISNITPGAGEDPLNQLAQKDLQQFYARMKTGGRLIRTEAVRQGAVRLHGARASRRLPVRAGERRCRRLIRTNHGGWAASCRPSGAGRCGMAGELSGSSSGPAEGYFQTVSSLDSMHRPAPGANCWPSSGTDLDFKTGTLTVNKQVYGVKGRLHGSVPKTRASIRRLGPAALRGGECCGTTGRRWTPGGCSPPLSKEDEPYDAGWRCAGGSRIIPERAGLQENQISRFTPPHLCHP